MSRKSSPAISTGSLRERAYSYIQRGVACGELLPDTAISEVAISKHLKMSRTPVREAIGQLVAEGLLEQMPNRGTVVVRLKRQDVIELYELREALEVYAARKAAHMTLRAADLERWEQFSNEILSLRDELRRLTQTTLSREQMRKFIAADLSFHNMLMHMSVNARILKVLNDTRLLIRIFGMEQPGYDEAKLKQIHDQHAAIIAAVTSRDSERAAQLLTRHIRTSLDERLQAYDVRERELSFQKSLPAFI